MLNILPETLKVYDVPALQNKLAAASNVVANSYFNVASCREI